MPQPKKGHREGSHNKRKTHPTAQPHKFTAAPPVVASAPAVSSAASASAAAAARRRQRRASHSAPFCCIVAVSASLGTAAATLSSPLRWSRRELDVSHASSCAGVGAWCVEGSCTIVASSVRICAGGRWVEIGPMRCGGKGRRLTLFDEENKLLGHQDEGQTEEHVLL
ncbi:hypothetical protein BC826DRAFT_972985 [Russula brevipes]|nr:hypothetical protein BC826DRAFT_972985 [Russula brevipes]